MSKKVRVAIAGLGNCASALVQGLEYYKNADEDDFIPGIMHVKFGDYHLSDVGGLWPWHGPGSGWAVVVAGDD